MVLRGPKRQDVGPVGQHEQANFLALQKFLDHRFTAACAKQVGERTFRFLARHGDGDALARREAIGLDHHRHAELVECRARLGAAGRVDIACGRDSSAVAHHLGEGLRSFELGGGFVRAEHRDPGDAETVAKAIHQWRFRADDDKLDALLGTKSDHSSMIAHVERHDLRVRRNARIAGRGEQRIEARRLRELPRERMFATTRTDQQDIQWRTLKTCCSMRQRAC